MVTPKEALVGEPRQGHIGSAWLTILEAFDHLLQPLFPAAVGHHPPGMFVDDLHLAISHQIVVIELELVMRHQCLLNQPFTPRTPYPTAGVQRLSLLGESLT